MVMNPFIRKDTLVKAHKIVWIILSQDVILMDDDEVKFKDRM